MKCDFCGHHSPRWRYRCETFTAPGRIRSLEDWTACEVCRSLIDFEDWTGLARRAADQLGYPAPLCHKVHGLFREHRGDVKAVAL